VQCSTHSAEHTEQNTQCGPSPLSGSEEMIPSILASDSPRGRSFIKYVRIELYEARSDVEHVIIA
jgi:hypothetical protein